MHVGLWKAHIIKWQNNSDGMINKYYRYTAQCRYNTANFPPKSPQ